MRDRRMSEDDFPRCSCGHSFEDHQYPEDEHSSRSGMMSECQYVREGKDCACKSYDGLTSADGGLKSDEEIIASKGLDLVRFRGKWNRAQAYEKEGHRTDDTRLLPYWERVRLTFLEFGCERIDRGPC